MADSAAKSPGSEPRAEPEIPNTVSPARPADFTAINMDENREPRRLKLVSKQTMQAHTANNTIGEDGGPEPGFQGRPHGTDFWRPVLPGKKLLHPEYIPTCQLTRCRPSWR